MKVALLLSGQVREVEKSFPAIKKYIIDPTSCDIFARICKDEHTESLYSYLTKEDCVGWEIKEDFFISGIQFPFTGIDKNNRGQRYYQQLYGLYKVNEQRKKHGINYDLVIRCRIDLKPSMYLPNLSLYEDGTLYIPSSRCYGGANDQFAVSTPKVMDIYSNRFNWIQNINNTDHNAEQQLLRFMIEHNIKIKKILFNYDLTGADVGVAVKKTKVYKE